MHGGNGVQRVSPPNDHWAVGTGLYTYAAASDFMISVMYWSVITWTKETSIRDDDDLSQIAITLPPHSIAIDDSHKPYHQGTMAGTALYTYH